MGSAGRRFLRSVREEFPMGLSWYMRLFTGVAFLWQEPAALNWIQLGSVIPLSMVLNPSDRRLECSERSDRR
jgi:hypothetical protein